MTAPGTNVTPATRGEAGQFTTAGQRPNTNYFTVDGVSANNGVTAGGIPAQSTGGTLPPVSAFGSLDSLISPEVVDEFSIRTSSTGAEMGRLPGAQIAITSQSGANQWHGSLDYQWRNEVLAANDWFANQASLGTGAARLNEISQTLGGPLQRQPHVRVPLLPAPGADATLCVEPAGAVAGRAPDGRRVGAAGAGHLPRSEPRARSPRASGIGRAAPSNRRL